MAEILYEKLLENLFDGVYYVDTNKQISFWNKAAERITGFSSDEVMGHCCSENILRHIDDEGTNLCVEGCPLGDTLTDGKIQERSAYLHHKDGHRVPVSIRVTPIKNDKGDIIGAIEIFSDNSNRLEMMKEMEQLKNEVYIDALTQVGNRKFGEMTLETKLFDFRTHSVPYGVIFLDVDHFKKFNDTFGHDIGDQVLITVAKTIKNVIRKLDVVCRWGGEEFIVIVPNVTLDLLKIIAERIRIFIAKSFIMKNDEKLTVTVSIGATLARSRDTNEIIVKRADALMYQSKSNGRNQVTID